jgi:hypothetical protein
VISRLVTALEQQEQQLIHGASWPPRHHTGEVNRLQEEKEKERRHGFEPSATAASNFLPFKPGTSNPLKVLEGGDWNVWVVDQVRLTMRRAAHLLWFAKIRCPSISAQDQRVRITVQGHFRLLWTCRPGG